MNPPKSAPTEEAGLSATTIEETRADSVYPVLTQAMAGTAPNLKSVPASFSQVTNFNIQGK